VADGRGHGGTGELGFVAPPSGKYVTGITVNEGTIVIRFGNQANTAIGGQTLSLKPLVSPNQDVVWQCGNRAIAHRSRRGVWLSFRCGELHDCRQVPAVELPRLIPVPVRQRDLSVSNRGHSLSFVMEGLSHERPSLFRNVLHRLFMCQPDRQIAEPRNRDQ